MIVDKLSNIDSYATLSPEMGAVCRLLKQVDIAALQDGKNILDDDRIYANVSHSGTMPWEERQFEAHRDYIDIQCVLGGSELMGHINIESAVSCCDYDKETDLIFFREPAKCSRLLLSSGMFAIFLPEDAHKPSCQLEEKAIVHKVVIKVKLVSTT